MQAASLTPSLPSLAEIYQCMSGLLSTSSPAPLVFLTPAGGLGSVTQADRGGAGSRRCTGQQVIGPTGQVNSPAGQQVCSSALRTGVAMLLRPRAAPLRTAHRAASDQPSSALRTGHTMLLLGPQCCTSHQSSTQCSRSTASNRPKRGRQNSVCAIDCTRLQPDGNVYLPSDAG
jgi:hypothetical protein